MRTVDSLEIKMSHDMSGIGRNIGELNRKNLGARRMKKGQCPTCGNQTHKVGFFGKRTALTIEGTCLYGRCLLCNPVEGYARRPPDNSIVPRNLVISTEDHLPDDGTMVSGITMDHRLIVGARNWSGPILDDEESYDDSQQHYDGGGPMRPEPSVGTIGIDDGRPPDRRRPSRGDEGSYMSGGRPVGPPKRYASRHEEMMDKVGLDASRVIDEKVSMPSMTRRISRRRGSHNRLSEDGSSETPMEKNPARRVVSPSRLSRTVSPAPEGQASLDNYRQRQQNHSDMDPREIRVTPYATTKSDSRGPERRVERDPYTAPDVYVAPRHEQYKSDNDTHDAPSWGGGSREYAMNRETQFDSNGEHHHEYSARADGNFRNNSGGSGVFGKPAAVPEHGEDREARLSAKLPPADFEYNSFGKTPAPEQREFRTDQPAFNGARAAATTEPPPLVDRNRRGLPDDDFTDSPRPATGVARNLMSDNVRAPPQLVVDDDDPYGEDEAQEDPQEALKNDPTLKKNQTINDILVILHCLNLDQANTKLRERAFHSLADIVLSYGQKAKELIKQYQGIETLVQSMWTDMGIPSVQAAACELLFALAASVDGDGKSDVLVGDSAEGAVDALLISMQTHLSVESIQRSGCGTLCCLAAASGSNREVNDGTLSGAVLSIVSAMDMHKKALGVQEWGIRALYSQCLQSANSESNKISLASSGQDGGAGMDVIHCAMETAKSDLVTIELACRLYWCLSSSEEIAKTLSATTDPIYGIMNAVHLYRKRPEAAAMTEAAYGALANLARITDKNHGSLRDSGVISAAMESIGAFHYDEELYVEACALLSNLALNPANKEEILNYDAVNMISRLMHHYSHNATLQEEALNALLSLSADSVRAKMSMITEATVGSVIRLLQDRKSPTTMQELACSLLCSLSVQREGADMAVSQGAIEATLSVMKTSSGERRVQEAACMTLRNFACQGAGVDVLMGIDAVQTLVGTMQGVSESEIVQLNACCILWNLVEKAQKEPVTVADAGGIEQVVRAMQSHMESGEVLEMACGALWSLIDRSEDRKKSMVGSGAIDAVTCALVMHPKEPHTLEKACGLLANICTQSMMAEAIADSQGISMVVEAMRNNHSSLVLLELGTLVLRNLVLVNPEYALEASNGISTIINAMKDNPDAVDYQLEACNALWALAAQSEDCKSKIVALDGVQILMSALENNTPTDVQDAARGAINQLARYGGGGL